MYNLPTCNEVEAVCAHQDVNSLLSVTLKFIRNIIVYVIICHVLCICYGIYFLYAYFCMCVSTMHRHKYMRFFRYALQDDAWIDFDRTCRYDLRLWARVELYSFKSAISISSKVVSSDTLQIPALDFVWKENLTRWCRFM